MVVTSLRPRRFLFRRPGIFPFSFIAGFRLIRHHVLFRSLHLRPEIITHNVYCVPVGIVLELFFLRIVSQRRIIFSHNEIVGQSQENKDNQTQKHLKGEGTGKSMLYMLI